MLAPQKLMLTSLGDCKILLCVEFKGSMAAESLYFKISTSTSHIIFMAKTKLGTLGEGHATCLHV